MPQKVTIREFLAAREIINSQEKYFPSVKKNQHWKYETVQVLRPLEVTDLFSFGAISRDGLISFNPGLTTNTLKGLEVIPPNYVLRVPDGKSKHFYARLKRIPEHKREAAAHKVSTKYIAKGKESIQRIAKLFGISGDDLSEKMGKPLTYQPKGPLLIRSQFHLFSPLLEINQNILETFASTKTLEKPAEIGRVKGK